MVKLDNDNKVRKICNCRSFSHAVQRRESSVFLLNPKFI